jgi:Caspase domain/Domain of unknown function (DUF4384)
LWAGVVGVVDVATPGAAIAGGHALLIGIGDYAESGLMSLNGPDNDIALIRSVLKARVGLSDGDIVTLLDAQATHTAVQKAFADLAARVKPDDFVYIHYSGHGSYTDDKTQPGKVDQTWVTYGSRARKLRGLDDHDVLDKEINLWLQPIYKVTPNVVFVSDSCYSATVSRAARAQGARAAPTARAAPADPRTHPLGAQPFAPNAAMPGVRIGAARDWETAVEVDPNDGGACADKKRCDGVFTWYWAQALQRAAPGDRWSDVFNRTYSMVVTRPYVLQRPQQEGHGERSVFGGELSAVKATVSIAAIDSKAGTARLAAGQVSGLTPGSVYRQYAPGRPGGLGDARVELTSVEPMSALGTVRGATLAVGDSVVEETHAYSFKPIRIFVDADKATPVDQAVLAQIVAALRGLKGFEIAAKPADAAWIIHVFRPDLDARPATPASSTLTMPLPPSKSGKPLAAWVQDARGAPLASSLQVSLADPKTGVAALSDGLTRFARAREVANLDAASATRAMNVQLTAYRADPSCRQDCFFRPSDTADRQPYRKFAAGQLADAESMSLKCGDVLSVSLKNVDGDKQSWYVYLLDIGPDGVIRAVFPTRYDNQDAARLTAGETRDLKDQTVLVLNATGIETLKLIATTEPIDVRLFETPLQVVASRSSLNPLESLLAQAMTSRAAVEHKDVTDWRTSQASFDVR